MEPQGVYPGFSPSSFGAPPAFPPPEHVAPPQAMRPLSTGEILDRTLALYRRHFWLFCGIGTVPALVLTLSSLLRYAFLGVQPLFPARGPQTPEVVSHTFGTFALMQLYFLPLSLLFLIVYGISKAATVSAVTELSNGRLPLAVDAYRAVLSQWLRWIGIVLRQLWTLLWPVSFGFGLLVVCIVFAARFRNTPVTFGALLLFAWLLCIAGLVLGILNYIRVALAEAAGVVENVGVNAAIRRSRWLVAGRKGRIFLALLLVYALHMVAGGLQFPFLILAQTTRGGAHMILLASQLLVGFIATALVTPVASIAMTLFYIDERVRREGYDIELLLQRSMTSASIPTER